ncbi:LysR substrate-binding domain-containing protein [Mesorhizobium loti]|uniref:LysR family transcriptional regulator n=1 Tax=Rhizobium loti TaxID=381 RepID=A0A1A5QQ34_RHILI|nr:LysR substrate-binding domain-containing protein [Mesorhizobium loti]OBP77890.1 LysR family transcriptional regulator [Mesorhizobium loti]OBQ69845.1 LysR family transcriptional regulator [Mesorhizobium loti]QKC73232.1 LysR family transcriptional regulator [Mesorhizobium loti]
MVYRFYDLPSLTALVGFEAAARHLSFNLAASELNVTAGEIGRQIKAIEDELGVPLFVRPGTSVILTSAGKELYSVLASSFSQASDVVGAIKRGDRFRNVTIASTDAFASMWLMPRMPRFWAQHGDITVDHVISDSSRDYLRAEVELRIRYGFGLWPDETAELLFGDVIYPVCGPGFAQEHSDATAKCLPKLPLLHVEGIQSDWAGWDEVLRRAGIPYGPLRGHRFSKFFVALQAAQADQGVAVGWHRLVRTSVEEGKLVRITDLKLDAPGGYYLTWNENRVLSPGAERLRELLRKISAEELNA